MAARSKGGSRSIQLIQYPSGEILATRLVSIALMSNIGSAGKAGFPVLVAHSSRTLGKDAMTERGSMVPPYWAMMPLRYVSRARFAGLK